MTHIENLIENLYIQLDHIHTNNKDDENYEDQVLSVENQISDLEFQKYYNTMENNSVSTNIIEKIYQYKGPVYRFDKYIGDSKLIETNAVSLKKAKSNIIYKIKMSLNLPANSNLSIDEKKIKEVN